jgi:hypothetical protein
MLFSIHKTIKIILMQEKERKAAIGTCYQNGIKIALAHDVEL